MIRLLILLVALSLFTGCWEMPPHKHHMDDIVYVVLDSQRGQVTYLSGWNGNHEPLYYVRFPKTTGGYTTECLSESQIKSTP